MAARGRAPPPAHHVPHPARLPRWRGNALRTAATVTATAAVRPVPGRMATQARGLAGWCNLGLTARPPAGCGTALSVSARARDAQEKQAHAAYDGQLPMAWTRACLVCAHRLGIGAVIVMPQRGLPAARLHSCSRGNMMAAHNRVGRA